MVDSEEYFPRGGTKPSVLFKKSSNFLGAPEKTEKKRKKPKKRPEGDDGYLSDEETREIDQSAKNCGVGLSYKTIKEGVLVLGRVRTIHETKMIVMLPCRMMGSVMACHVSEPYNKLLEAYVNDQVDKVRELPQMFRPGQYIAVKVLEAKEQSLMLSTMPQHVNGAKQHSDLHKGALFQAAVSSVEDHGYVMDIGIADTRAFLPKSEVNEELELDVGVITWVAVKSVSPSPGSSVVTLSATPSYIQGGVLRYKPKTPLLPGNTVEFTVDTPLSNGIEGHIFGDTTCYIQRHHVDKFKGKKPALGQKIKARVLYVLPTRNCPFLTMKNIFESTYPDLDKEQTLKDGDTVDEAQVLKIIGRSVYFKLGRDVSGIMSLKRVRVDEDLTDEEVLTKSYPVGSTHKVRVLCYNLSDYVYSVTDQPSILNEKYFSYQQLAPGELVDATVRSVNEKGGVDLTMGRIRGFVPHAHLSEAGVFVDPKKARTSKLPQKKYKVGQPVTARVLIVDLVKQTVILTLKPSLLAANLRVLKSYDEVEVGAAYVGVIRLIRDYLLVTFFNNVTAYVPRVFVSRDNSENVADAFHIGQIVTCTILDVKPEEKKMSGSLITAPFTRKENHNKNKRKQNQTDSADVPHKKRKDGDEETDKQSKKKNKQHKEENEDSIETKSKKKKRKDTDTSQDSQNESEINQEKDRKKKKKNKDKTKISEKSQDDSQIESDIEQETEKTAKKKSKSKEEAKMSEESDAIETDFQEEELLTPHEQGLLDMSDCSTLKDYKKRVVSFQKSINARARRIDAIDAKLENIEKRGLTAKNKKFHTAMHSEKLQIQERIKKLLEGIKEAQEKLKELGYVKNDDYKLEQKKRKQERKLAAIENKKKERLANETKSDDKENEESVQVNTKVDKKKKKDKTKKNKEENKVKEEIKDKIKEIKVVDSLEPALEVPSAKDFWSANADNLSKVVQEDESSSSEDEEKDQPKKKRKKLTVADKLAKARDEEERVRALERAAVESEAQPRSVEQFERSALANPGSSQLWIAYMAFHLQATELDKARAVARKALNAIPFREEHDKLNVWLALINLEQRFGTKESQQKTLEDALQMNDPYKVHSKLLDIYAETGKQQELAALADLMMRKHKRNPDAYIQAGGACYRLGMVDKARQVMQKAIAVLEKKDHVTVLVQFALLERNHGARERAEALFEQVLAVYPQRVDVCSVYVDMLVKGGDVEQVRQVMERMTSLKLPARKMKVLYKKWVEVEEKLGDEAQVESIRQRAMDFIETAKF